MLVLDIYWVGVNFFCSKRLSHLTPPQLEATQEAAQALQSVEPPNLNPLLGSFLIPQWRDDKKPDLWVGQGQLFLKNQDATRALCAVVYTIRINFAQDQMVNGMHNMSLRGTYGTDMHQDVVWLRGKFPKWMPRCGCACVPVCSVGRGGWVGLGLRDGGRRCFFKISI